jgi:hypothetical protein
MRTELKRAITDFIFEHENEFQLTNTTTEKFRAYIYNSEGNYLIGGKDVSHFIKYAIGLLINY